MKKFKYIFLLSCSVFLLSSLSLMAQDPGPDPGGDPDAPIDGGISLLVAAGAIYGAKKIKENQASKA